MREMKQSKFYFNQLDCWNQNKLSNNYNTRLTMKVNRILL